MKTLTALLLLLAMSATAQEANTSARPALSAKATEAYELKAESKLREFYDYVSLLTDPALKAEMKAQAFREALKLYQSEHTDTDNIFSPRGEEVTIYKLLKNATESYSKCTYDIKEFSAKLTENTPTGQIWLLTYELHTNNRSWHRINQYYHVVQEDKKFGNTTRKVWNTYLGEIDVREWRAKPKE